MSKILRKSWQRVVTIIITVIMLATPAITGFAATAVKKSATDSPTPPPPSGRLKITDDSANRVTGRFTRGSSFVDFEGTSHSPVSASVKLDVNGKQVAASRDMKAGTAKWDAGGATLLPEDREVMLGLAKELSKTWIDTAHRTKTILPGHKDLVARLSMLLAEAPLGVSLTAQDISLQQDQAVFGLTACQQSDDDGILYFANCGTYSRWFSHDAESHCFENYSVHSGPGSTDCLGECGPGCDGTNAYTVDCGDHDYCVRTHPEGGSPTDPWHNDCGDEFWEADDDYLSGDANCY